MLVLLVSEETRVDPVELYLSPSTRGLGFTQEQINGNLFQALIHAQLTKAENIIDLNLSPCPH
jgi:hypothetical protein